MSAIKSIGKLGFPFKTPDPFLFCVYHRDDYPAGDDKMQAPRRGDGMDFDWNLPYRMYHGERVPGFPQHPHRGFETITVTTEGLVDHTDSLGNSGRYGHGDLQWMTAGGGIVHGEMFPLVNKDKPNPLKLFQIWINLPAKNKMVTPGFKMHWAENMPKISRPGVEVVLYAGKLEGLQGQEPPEASYACDPASDVSIITVDLQAGGSYVIPPAAGGASTNRTLYFIEGDRVKIAGQELKEKCMLICDASKEVSLEGVSGPAQVLMLQGKPIGEPVAQHGPFVMNTQAEIQQCFADYRRTQFGGWPWPEDAMVFPREKGRFAHFNGKEETPPATN